MVGGAQRRLPRHVVQEYNHLEVGFARLYESWGDDDDEEEYTASTVKHEIPPDRFSSSENYQCWRQRLTGDQKWGGESGFRLWPVG